MSNFKNWNEYLDARKKMVEKPTIDTVSDYPGPIEMAPEDSKQERETDASKTEMPKTTGKPALYVANVNANKGQIKQVKGEAPLGDIGDKGLIYNPDTKINPKTPAGGKVSAADDYVKTKTESFIDDTKKMSTPEFAKYVLERCGYCGDEEPEVEGEEEEEVDGIPMITAYAAGKFHPDPREAIEHVTALATKNERILEKLIHALKDKGILGKALETALDDHPESYGHLTGLFGDEEKGPKRADSFARAMDSKHSEFLDKFAESVAPPFGMEDEEDGEKPADDDIEDEPSEDDGDEMDGQEPDEDGGEEDGSGEAGDIDGDEQMPPPEHPDEGEEEGGEEMEKEMPSKKRHLKPQKFAHDHLMGAMSKYPHMKDGMKKHMGAF